MEPGAVSDSDAGAGADGVPARAATPVVTKQVFRAAPGRTHAVPSAAARKTQGARAHPPIPLDRPGSVHSDRFPPLTDLRADMLPIGSEH